MNTANKLTLARIICVPIFVTVFYLPFAAAKYIAAGVFIIAFITDIMDGYIARKENIVTSFGKLLDPIADKLMMTAALILLCSVGELSAVIVVVIISREFIVSALRMVASSEGIVLGASWLGKLKTITQCIAVVALLIKPVTIAILSKYGPDILVWIALIMTVWSGIDYLLKNWKLIDFS